MNHDPNKKPVSLEDLLRLKRTESPAQQFWSDWQQGMRSKLDKAMEEKRPWWRDALPRVWITIARWHIPMGATALAALAFVAVHEYTPSLPALPSAQPEQFASNLVVAPAGVADSQLHQGNDRPITSIAPGDITRAVAMISQSEMANDARNSRTARAIAANFEYVRSLEGNPVSQLHSGGPDFSAQAATETVQTPAAGRETRHARMLSNYRLASYVGSSASLVPADHTLNRLNEDQVFESANRRVGVVGSKLSLKF